MSSGAWQEVQNLAEVMKLFQQVTPPLLPSSEKWGVAHSLSRLLNHTSTWADPLPSEKAGLSSRWQNCYLLFRLQSLPLPVQLPPTAAQSPHQPPQCSSAPQTGGRGEPASLFCFPKHLTSKQKREVLTPSNNDPTIQPPVSCSSSSSSIWACQYKPDPDSAVGLVTHTTSPASVYFSIMGLGGGRSRGYSWLAGAWALFWQFNLISC